MYYKFHPALGLTDLAEMLSFIQLKKGAFMRNTIYVFTMVVLFTLQLMAQGFGQNKVQYQEFSWHYLQSEHFDVYFYPGAYQIATFVANEAESSYVSLKRDFKYEITKRVKIILYKSHNDFQQTNVVDSYMPEGVGGVTELYKNRVVIPFEGSYSQLRHVLHHELVHAVMNDMLYGGSVQSLVSGQVVPVPTWFAEGLAEYFSMRWDTRADMIIRDATMSGYLPPIKYLSYYLAYQGGESVFRYIAQKYGIEKISEILHKIKGSFRFEGAFKSALGISLDELSEEWQKEMRKEYWPDIADRAETRDIARVLTHHKKTKNYLNISPTLSPKGDKMVFLSDKDGKQSIFLMDVLENKIVKRLIKGEASVDFEELHWLSPGMGWSPDGTKVTFTAKAGDQDALYIYDVTNDEIQQFKFDLDGLFSAAWSPVRPEIAFIGNKNGASDIFIYNVETKKLQNITNDPFADSYPKWSADGNQLVFVSERGAYVTPDMVPKNFSMAKHDFNNTDIYLIDRTGENISRLTDSPARESDPVLSPDGKLLLYCSDESGIYNIYKKDLETDSTYAITNLLTGAFQLNLNADASTLAFASFSEGGWDIYTIKDPFKQEAVSPQPHNTVYKTRLLEKKTVPLHFSEPKAISKTDSVKKKITLPHSANFRNYVFADLNRRTIKKKVKVALKKDQYKLEDGHYKVHNYRVTFSPDVINGAAGYSTLWGFQGYTSLAFSDVLGNHKIFVGTNLVFDLKNSYLSLQYWYLPKRIDYGFSLFHYANTYFTYTDYIRYRYYGLWGLASYPFSKYSRMDVSLNWWNAEMEVLTRNYPISKIQSIIPGIRYVYDTSEWRWPETGPRDGFRGSVDLKVSPHYSSDSPEFVTLKMDARKYFKLSDTYSLALRLSAGLSRGANPQQFFLGGVSNWLNRDFRGDVRIGSLSDVYFGEFVTPLRGARYYERTGDNYGLMNLEFRFPLIPYMQLGFPPITLGNIQGLLFVDAGSALYSKELYQFRGMVNGRLKDIVASYGIGSRLFIFGMLLRYDVAWRYDIRSSSAPVHLISLGIDI